eukprot:5517419-Prymnesium_polylepis.1
MFQPGSARRAGVGCVPSSIPHSRAERRGGRSTWSLEGALGVRRGKRVCVRVSTSPRGTMVSARVSVSDFATSRTRSSEAAGACAESTGKKRQ